MGSHEHTPRVPAEQPATAQHEPSWQQLFVRHFPLRDFVVGGVIPYVIYAIWQNRGQPVTGVVFAGGWSLAVVLVGWWRTGRIQGFALLGTIFAAIQVVTTLITGSAAVYILTGIVNNVVEGLVYLVSLCFPRSLIQIAAEATGATAAIPEWLRRSPAYRRAWQILTAVWGLVSIAKALLLLAARQWLAVDAVLALGILTGWPLLIALLAFTFWFPGWYWRRQA